MSTKAYRQLSVSVTNETEGETGIPSGIYIARLVTPDYTKSIKMVLLK